MSLLRWLRERQRAAPQDRRALGAAGEEAAAQHLRRQGYRIVARNYRCPLGEIDLVATRGPWQVFVEVKTRTSDRFGSPQESVTRAKGRKLAALAEHYRNTHPGESRPKWRIDVIAVDARPGERPRVLAHIESAVEEPEDGRDY